MLTKIYNKFHSLYKDYKIKNICGKLGYCGNNVSLYDTHIHNPQNIFLEDDVSILSGFSFISQRGKFIMKKGSTSARNLTVITDSHIRKVGKHFKDYDLYYQYKSNPYKDVIVEEEVWIGANVSILPGVVVGRCSNIGTGAVLRNSVPPYSIVTGNPAKVIGFVFTPEEIIEHEKYIFPEAERLPYELLEKNYEKYFLKRITEIKEYNKI